LGNYQTEYTLYHLSGGRIGFDYPFSADCDISARLI
jgi:hypothetical protein